MIKKLGVILEPDPSHEWEAGAVFNCGVVIHRQRFHMLYRAVWGRYKKTAEGYENYISFIGHASSTDGIHFERDPEPVMIPESSFDRFGCEDPRITPFEGRFLITYTALSMPASSGRGYRVALAETKDFKVFSKYGVVIPDIDDKDAVIFPKRINGKIAIIHRAFGRNIQIAYMQRIPESKEFWKGHIEEIEKHTILRPTYSWEAIKIGAGVPPIEVESGYLLIYHAKGQDHKYRVGAALLDREHPHRVIARLSYPIIEPTEEFEIEGDVKNVVFPCGAVQVEHELYIYYGAADKRCALAILNLPKLLNKLETSTPPPLPLHSI